MAIFKNDIPPPTRRDDGSAVSTMLSQLPLEHYVDISLADKGPNYRNNLYQMARRHGISITVRKYPDYYRVWRIE